MMRSMNDREMIEMIEMTRTTRTTRTTSEGLGAAVQGKRTSDDLDPGRTFNIKHRKVIESRQTVGNNRRTRTKSLWDLW